MRLSEIKGEAALDCIEAIVGPAARIISDADMAKLLGSGGTRAAIAADAANLLLSKHRDDTVAILAALNLQSPSEYLAASSLPKIIGDVYAAITDEELLAFLPQQSAASGTTSDATREG